VYPAEILVLWSASSTKKLGKEDGSGTNRSEVFAHQALSTAVNVVPSFKTTTTCKLAHVDYYYLFGFPVIERVLSPVLSCELMVFI
jgi:hypothetical protein